MFNIAANCLQRMVQLAQSSGQIVGLIPHLMKGVGILKNTDGAILFIQDDVDNGKNKTETAPIPVGTNVWLEHQFSKK